MRKNCSELVMSVDNNLASSMMRLLDCFMNAYKEDDVKKVTKEMIENLSSIIK